MHDLVFLFDVDNTLLDNDRVQADLADHLTHSYGADACNRYWDIFEEVRRELGYADYLGALERFRLETMHDPRVLLMSSWLVDYPFADRIYNGAVSAVRHVQRWRSLPRAYIIYVHKEQELADVERFYPAKRPSRLCSQGRVTTRETRSF